MQLALNYEIIDLRLVVQDVKDILGQERGSANSRPPASLMNALERMKTTLLGLQILIAYELTTLMGDGDFMGLDRSMWIRSKRQI